MTKRRASKQSRPRSNPSDAQPMALGGPDFEALAGKMPGTGTWSDHFQRFTEAHASWWGRVSQGRPVYALPEVVIDVLSVAPCQRGKPPLLSLTEVAGERALRTLCEMFSADTVGVWNNRPVTYPLLGETSLPTISNELMGQLGWTGFGPPGAIATTQGQAQSKSDLVRHQQLGYAGRLTCDRQYQEEKAKFRSRWESLRPAIQLPLVANTHDRIALPAVTGGVGPAQVLPQNAARFLDDVGRFLRKWQLVRLVTWDLPEPQGPLECVPVGAAAHLLGPGQGVSTIPTYFDVPADSNMRAEIRDRQRQAAREVGIEAEHPATDIAARASRTQKGESALRTSQWETAFRMWFIERTLVQRYGSRHGLIAGLKAAFKKLFTYKTAWAEELRDLYKRFVNLP